MKKASEESIEESQAIKLGKKPYKINVVNRIPTAFLDVISAQFTILQSWVEPMAKMQTLDAAQFRRAVEATFERYEELVERVKPIDNSKSNADTAMADAETADEDANIDGTDEDGTIEQPSSDGIIFDPPEPNQ